MLSSMFVLAAKRSIWSTIKTAKSAIQSQNQRSKSYLASLNKSTKDYCKIFGIETLYHITMIVNIPSILINGLLSHNKVKEQKAWVFPALIKKSKELERKNL
jgi:hypothetical protein